jgi:hypothetical protein
LSFHFPISLLKKQFWKINCPRLPLIWCEIHPQFPWVSKAGDSSARLHQKVEIHQQSSTERAYGVKAWELETAKIATWYPVRGVRVPVQKTNQQRRMNLVGDEFRHTLEST